MLSRCLEIERSIITKYRKEIWRPFTKAVRKYHLVNENDKIAVCISGGKDSFLLAKCMQELQRHGKVKFDLEFLVMDPGYLEEHLAKIMENAKRLEIPITIMKSSIFDVVDENHRKGNPCYLCARMRRGFLYDKAKSLGCNKIALGHHFDDVIETVLLSVFYGGEYKSMPPKLQSTNFKGMELIRPLYFIREKSIISWKNYHQLEFIDCACKVTTKNHLGDFSKRFEMKQLIKELEKSHPNISYNIFRSTENVNIETLLGVKKNNQKTLFFEEE